MSNINELVNIMTTTPSKSTSTINFESLDGKLRSILELTTSEKVGNVVGKSISATGSAIGKAASAAGKGMSNLSPQAKKALAVGAAGTGLVGAGALASRKIGQSAISNQQVGNTHIAASKAADGVGKHIQVTPDTIAGKAGNMTQNLGVAASKAGEHGKRALGGVMDWAANNSGLALGAGGLAGIALINKLRRRRNG